MIVKKFFLNLHSLISPIKRLSVLFIPMLLSANSLASPPLEVAWNERPPYQYLNNGKEAGERLMRVKNIFNKTGIPFVFVQEPPKRIWTKYAAGIKNYCSFDWYRLPEREELVQFSLPIERNPSYSVLTNLESLSKVKLHSNLASLLSDPTLTLGLVDSASYGTELENMIRNSRNKLERHNVLPVTMARMIGANRASFMLIEKVTWDFLKNSDVYFKQTTIIDIDGVPKGLDSYIVCSKDVTKEKMLKINEAIRKLTPVPTTK